ncbi:hypothetical protein DSM104299_03112 [Baekduia alba]|uniref:tyrosinase family protein n=1 Tax=Baekduia alba TaxID=2997333 RepID=UPI00233FB8AE|nr:tyrosinase family protein [Baekduia alba]WCB94378.1 hypothetical protein DSM104299_03112 [Baekduia alba]
MAASSVVSREDIRSWAPDSPKLHLLRKGIEGMQALSEQSLMDERGYQYMAGVHGGFGNTPYCQHSSANFVTWHRPYLLDFELKLRAQIAKVADQATADEWRLPYWKWDDPEVAGIPDAFTAETYDDAGTERPNPLLSQPYLLPYPISDTDPPYDATWRDPRPIQELRDLRETVERALGEPAFFDFTGDLEQAHNGVHRWARGFMLSLRSSFDPIFWCHHCNVDRQFWDWQTNAGDQASIPLAVRNFECLPFRFTDIRAAAFFDTRALGYTYAIERQLVVPDEAAAGDGGRLLSFPAPPARFDRVRVNFHGVTYPELTTTVVLSEDDVALAEHTILGHGRCPGGEGHCDPDQQTGRALRPAHHRAPFDFFVDVTKHFQGGGPVQILMRLVDADDRPLPSDTISFDNATLTFR